MKGDLGLFILSLVLLAAAVAAGVIAKRKFRVAHENTYNQRFARGALAAAAVLSLGFMLALGNSIFTKVPPKNFGIGVELGRPVDQYPNGTHLKWPWIDINNMDGAVQVDKHEQSPKATNCDGGVKVRLGNQSLACANVIVTWQINQSGDKVLELYKNYKHTETVGDKVVNPALNTAANDAFGQYDPLQNLDANGKPKLKLSDIANTIGTTLETQLGDDVTIKSVRVTVLDYDKQTEDKINSFQAALADTRIAEQRTKTAQQEAKANETLKKSLTDPNLVPYLCIKTEEDMVKKGMTPPAAHCGSVGGVLVDGTTRK